jgi:hypothetical protein
MTTSLVQNREGLLWFHAPSQVQMRTTASNRNTYATWCCRGLHLTISKMVQNRTPILIASAALIAFGSMTSFIPQHPGFTILKQATFALTCEGVSLMCIQSLRRIKNKLASQI